MPCSNGQIGIHFMNHSMISTPDRDPFGEANFELFDFNENKHYPRHDSIKKNLVWKIGVKIGGNSGRMGGGEILLKWG